MSSQYKNDAQNLADYFLSQDHERDEVMRRYKEEYKDDQRPWRTINKELRESIPHNTWAGACRVLYGKKEARKMITELIADIKEEVR